MIHGALVLRPEPGAARTAARLEAAGVEVLRMPLFTIQAVPWQPPDPARFDAMLLTSANAVRHAGAGLAALARLPAVAVGEPTAAAAHAAGLTLAAIGHGDAQTAARLGREHGLQRLIHLAGRDHVEVPDVEVVTVYDSHVLAVAPGTAHTWEGWVALLHSARAAVRFAEIVDRDQAARDRIAVVALSPAVAEAAGPGWFKIGTASRPSDADLVAQAVALIDRSGGEVDKRTR